MRKGRNNTKKTVTDTGNVGVQENPSGEGSESDPRLPYQGRGTEKSRSPPLSIEDKGQKSAKGQRRPKESERILRM